MDQKHFHTHILVSGNNLLSPQATRQSKAQLRENHLHLLQFIKENHPELTIGIDQEKWGRSENDERTYYAKQRSTEPLDKDTLREHIQDIFRMSENTNCKLPQKQDSLKLEIYFNHKLLNNEKEQIQSHSDSGDTQGV